MMNTRFLPTALLLLLACHIAAAQAPRVRYSMDKNWKFHFGHAADPRRDFNYAVAKNLAKAGEVGGALRPDFDDTRWRTLDVPHDWAVELPFVQSTNPDVLYHGFKPVGGEYPETSIGWYRKAFFVAPADSNSRFSLQFDGIFRDADIWLNGHFLGNHESGYSEFRVDVTDYLHFLKKNVLVVRVDARQYEGWFYEGAGIYRHVWLEKTAPLHLEHHGVYARSVVEGKNARVYVEAGVQNAGGGGATCSVRQRLYDAMGKLVAQKQAKARPLEAGKQTAFSAELQVAQPVLWSLENPYRYQLVTEVFDGKQRTDSVSTFIGIRTVAFDVDKGFFLNGQPLKIKGVCCHQDHAGVGSALPDDLIEFRIKRLKEMGANAYRSSHNPPTPEVLDACDRLGMLVLDETRLMGASGEYLRQFETLIRRDRNHPSVFLWCIGNEEWMIQNNETGKKLAQTLMRRQQQLDPGRTCTYAANNGGQRGGINAVIPIRGFNYFLDAADEYHTSFPTQPILGSEVASTVCTRGEYAKDSAKGYLPDTDTQHPDWGTTAERWWRQCAERDWLMGGFVWTGFDYRGEPTPYGWPCINSHFGIMDMCGYPKNIYYYYQSWWSGGDVLHLLPHWNWAGREGQAIDVWCYSNADEVELTLNGKSLGRQTMPRNGHLNWSVPYAPGELSATAYRNGKAIGAPYRVRTTGPAARINARHDKATLCADGEDLAVVDVWAADDRGDPVPTASDTIYLELQGPGRILGVGNGDPSSHEADRCLDGRWQRALFNGKCQVLVQAADTAGQITLRLRGKNLSATTLTLQTRACAPAAPRVAEAYADYLRHKAWRKPVQYRHLFAERYAGGGPGALTDGLTGSADHTDGFWQGFLGDDLEVVIDFQSDTTLRQLNSTWLANPGAWIHLPEYVEYYGSKDGQKFELLARVPRPPGDYHQFNRQQYRADVRSDPWRYLKVVAKNPGVNPPGHPAAGEKSWIFVDEIVAY